MRTDELLEVLVEVGPGDLDLHDRPIVGTTPRVVLRDAQPLVTQAEVGVAVRVLALAARVVLGLEALLLDLLGLSLVRSLIDVDVVRIVVLLRPRGLVGVRLLALPRAVGLLGRRSRLGLGRLGLGLLGLGLLGRRLGPAQSEHGIVHLPGQ